MKSKYFIRYKLIIEKLQRSGRVSYEELESYLYDKFDILGNEFSYSIRTFQRDKKDIYDLFGILIVNDRSDNTYSIDEEDISEPIGKLLDAFTISNALRLHDDLSNIISFENQNFGAQGLFYELSDAVKSKNRIKLYYQKYYKEQFDEYILEPLALKEFRQRWYLVASNLDGLNPRTFALDRVLKLEIQKAKFENTSFDLDVFFSDYYGIMTDRNSKFSKVKLRFENLQGKYIKSMPLHHSQEVIRDDEDGLEIELKLHITFDFKQKLLSYGSLMKVLYPEFLKDEMITEFKKAGQKYK